MIKYLLILLTIASCLILFQFSSIPANLAYDEIHFAKIALSLDGQSLTPYSPLSSGHATPYFYLILASFKLFGITTTALRIPSALFGILATIPAFLIFSEVFKKKNYAFLATLLFISSRWYFNFARFSFEATFLIFLELMSIYLLLRFLKEKRSEFLIFCALFAGIAFQSYYPGRIFFLIPLVMLLFTRKVRDIILYSGVFLLVASPLLLYYSGHPDIRVSELSVFSAKDLSTSDRIGQIAQNVKGELLMFHVVGDGNGRHNYPYKPAVNPIIGVFFLIGLGVLIQNLRKREYQLFLLYFDISLLPTLLTYSWENPNMLRTVTALFPLIYFAVIGLQFLSDRFGKRVYYIGVLLLLLGSVYDVRTYFAYQSRVFRNAFEISCPLQKVVSYEIAKIPKSCRVKGNLY